MLVRVDGAFNELQNAGCTLERWLTKTVIGLSTRVIAKVTSHTLKLLLRRTFGIKVRTFRSLAHKINSHQPYIRN